MSEKFSDLLTNEQKRSILEQRLQGFAVEGYQIVINKQLAQAEGNEDAIRAADLNIETLEKAVDVYLAELQGLPANEVAE